MTLLLNHVLRLRFMDSSLQKPLGLELCVTEALVVISFSFKQLRLVTYAVVAAMQRGVTLGATLGHRMSLTCSLIPSLWHSPLSAKPQSQPWGRSRGTPPPGSAGEGRWPFVGANASAAWRLARRRHAAGWAEGGWRSAPPPPQSSRSLYCRACGGSRSALLPSNNAGTVFCQFMLPRQIVLPYLDLIADLLNQASLSILHYVLLIGVIIPYTVC